MDREYHVDREQVERARAAKCDVPEAREAHLQLAEMHGARARPERASAVDGEGEGPAAGR